MNDGSGEAAQPRGGDRRGFVLGRLSELGASAQAAIPGLYAWSITVAPTAWARGAPGLARVASIVGIIALVTAPFVEGAGPAAGSADPARSWRGPTWARVWSVWGFVLSSAIVWTLAPGGLSSARLDGVRGVLGVIGWGLFAFASAGPTLRSDPDAAARIVAGTPLRPRSELPGGDGAYLVAGALVALGMQSVGWAITSPERAVLVRLVTVVSGVAVLGGTTSIALARHAARTPASRGLRLRRALPWVVVLALVVSAGLALRFR
ncbi:MAG: hypothetical protein JWP97_5565 [Labilithrix sp.]|nr:hypothetical protein [Labilithrix sp.]